ncbi:MAG: serine hydrolase [Chloroflexi bacterium]|nr:serine hydrolase [Chloroflexota bacterium]MCY4247732.1 serine hydrolase [Chloroflexota bacterium]
MTIRIQATTFDSLLAEHLPRTFPALGICVIHRGEVALEAGWGWLDPPTRQLPVTTESLFDLASVSKLLVEVSFLTLVEAGAVGMDDALVAVIPEFGRINPRAIDGGQDPHTRAFLPAEARFDGVTVDPTTVTFKHLLTHSSGLAPWRSIYRLAGENPPPPPQPTEPYDLARWQRGLAAMVEFPFVGTVGDTVRYTDVGIMLLGEAVARLFGGRLDQAVRALVLQPLGLRSFTYNPIQNGIPRERVAPTELDNHWRMRRVWGEAHDENACGLGGIAGHAGLFATAGDVARFGQAWLSGDSRLPVGTALRSLATQEQVCGQFRLGLGWMLKAGRDSSAGDLYSQSAYGHTGFTGASLWIDPERQLVCALLANRVYHGRHPEGIHAFRRAAHDRIVTAIDRA